MDTQKLINILGTGKHPDFSWVEIRNIIAEIEKELIKEKEKENGAIQSATSVRAKTPSTKDGRGKPKQ